MILSCHDSVVCCLSLPFVELSEFFSCILYTEVSESWTTPSLARKMHDVRVTKNHGPDLLRPSPNQPSSPIQLKLVTGLTGFAELFI